MRMIYQNQMGRHYFSSLATAPTMKFNVKKYKRVDQVEKDIKTGAWMTVSRVKRIQYPARKRLMMQDCLLGTSHRTFLIFQTNGMNSKENSAFRSKLKSWQFQVKFVSPSILKAALKSQSLNSNSNPISNPNPNQENPFSPLLSIIAGPTMIVYSNASPEHFAGEAMRYVMDSNHGALLIAAKFEEALFSPEGFCDVVHQAHRSALSLPKLHTELVAGLLSGASMQLLHTLQSPAMSLLRTLTVLENEHREKENAALPSPSSS